MTKPRLYIHVNKATHFLSRELPYFERYFDVVDAPDSETILFVFGPDALASGANLPANKRVALLFPGFSYNPYHNLVHRYGMQKIIEDFYDLVFVNPGPMHEVFKDSNKMHMCPFSINADIIRLGQYRRKIDSLLHASADSPQKDWTRSRDIMQLTGLKYEVFPPRKHSIPRRLSSKIRTYMNKKGFFHASLLSNMGYEAHENLIAKYHQYEAFVHVAAETSLAVDGKYTATLFEAGLAGCILFWHDTLGLGNDFETIFDLPLDPATATKEIQYIRKNINVEAHSRRTVEEIYEQVNPDYVMKVRFEAIKELL